MEDATIEDEPEVEEPQRPQNAQGLLSWTFIGKTLSQQWAIFFIISIGVAIFLYVSARQRKNAKRSTTTTSKLGNKRK